MRNRLRLNRLNRKLNSRKGFSLTELLAAVLILGMVSTVVAGGIPVARDAYEKVTLSANAQVMLSTAISALRNELCTASDVSVLKKSGDDYVPVTEDASGIASGGIAIEFYNAAIRNYSRISMGPTMVPEEMTGSPTMNETVIQHYSRNTGEDVPLQRCLLSSAAGDEKRLHVIFESAAYDNVNGIITFTGLRVVQLVGNNKVCRAKMKDRVSGKSDGTTSELKIRLIAP